MLVVVDTNPGEDALFEALLKHTVGDDKPVQARADVRRQRLDVGDVRVSATDGDGDGMAVVFERKTWADLASSICDGRLVEQKSRMVEPNTRYVCVVEGPQVHAFDGMHRNMGHRCMWGALIKMQLRDGFDVLFARSADDMAMLVLYIAQQMREGGFAMRSQHSTLSGTAPMKRKRDNLSDPTAVLRAMLTVVPGMSCAKAAVVAEAYPTVARLVAATPTELATLSCGTRALGPKMAIALKNVFTAPTADPDAADDA